MQRQSKRGADVEMAGHKLKAPDKDTTVLPLPHGESNDIGPIWTDRDSSGEGARQVSVASPVRVSSQPRQGIVLHCSEVLRARLNPCPGQQDEGVGGQFQRVLSCTIQSALPSAWHAHAVVYK